MIYWSVVLIIALLLSSSTYFYLKKLGVSSTAKQIIKENKLHGFWEVILSEEYSPNSYISFSSDGSLISILKEEKFKVSYDTYKSSIISRYYLHEAPSEKGKPRNLKVTIEMKAEDLGGLTTTPLEEGEKLSRLLSFIDSIESTTIESKSKNDYIVDQGEKDISKKITKSTINLLTSIAGFSVLAIGATLFFENRVSFEEKQANLKDKICNQATQRALDEIGKLWSAYSSSPVCEFIPKYWLPEMEGNEEGELNSSLVPRDEFISRFPIIYFKSKFSLTDGEISEISIYSRE